MDTLPLHPKLVHIPIALAVLMPLLTSGLLVAWWRQWFARRTWAIAVALQAVLVGTGYFSMESGEEAEEVVEDIVPESALEAHEEAAEVFVWTSAGVLLLALLGLGLPGDRRGLIAAGVATVGTVVVLGLGYRVGEAGGRLVYQYGAGQAYVDAAAAGSTPSGEAPRGGRDHDDDDD